MSDESEGGKTLIPLFDRLAAGDTSAADEIIKHSYGATGGSTVRTAEDLVTFIQGIRAAPLQPKAIGMAVSQSFLDGVQAKQVHSLHAPIRHHR